MQGGDHNGDGYADVAVHFGSTVGPSVAAGVTLATTSSLRAVVDVNRDGYADRIGQ